MWIYITLSCISVFGIVGTVATLVLGKEVEEAYEEGYRKGYKVGMRRGFDNGYKRCAQMREVI